MSAPFVVLDHRFRKGEFELLVKEVNNEKHWEFYDDICTLEPIKNYMGRFPRPLKAFAPDGVDNTARRPDKHIPQINAVDTNKHPIGKYAGRISFSKILMGFIFCFVLWGSVLNAQPVLGPVFDLTCSSYL